MQIQFRESANATAQTLISTNFPSDKEWAEEENVNKLTCLKMLIRKHSTKLNLRFPNGSVRRESPSHAAPYVGRRNRRKPFRESQPDVQLDSH